MTSRVGFSRQLAVFARKTPEKRAVESDFGGRSFSELYARVTRLARLFVDSGLKHGDRLCLLCKNRPEYVEVMAAAEISGISVISLVHEAVPREIEYVLHDSGTKALVVDALLSRSILSIRNLDYLLLRLSIDGYVPGFSDFEDLQTKPPYLATKMGILGQPIYYSSGTTGVPRAVIGRRFSKAPMSKRLPEIYNFKSNDKYFCPFPLFHSGLFFIAVATALSHGATVYLHATLEPTKILSLMSREHITHVYLSTFLFHEMRKLPSIAFSALDISHLRCVLHGAAPCPIEVKRWAIEKFGEIVWEYYGGTEGGGVCISSQEWLAKPGSVGRPDAELDMKIVGESGQEVGERIVGKVYFRAPEGGRFSYLNDPEKTDAIYIGDHYTMGDLGFVDEGGYLFLTGRSDDTVNIGGYNVYPEEVDQVLLEFPGVEASLSFGVQTTDGKGEGIVAMLKISGAGIELEQLMD
ncbi:MAG: AMP-binding protein, partial [Ferrovibrio sp.]